MKTRRESRPMPSERKEFANHPEAIPQHSQWRFVGGGDNPSKRMSSIEQKGSPM
jgi:hypothetical protein